MPSRATGLGDAAYALTQACQSGSTSAATALSIAQICTTFAIGVIASILAWIQSKNSRFRPRARAAAEIHPDHPDEFKRIAVRISNKGGAAGMIRFIDVRYGDQFKNYRDAKMVGWGPGSPSPFYLPGRAAAQIVIEPAEGERFTKNDRIVFGHGLKSEKRVKKIAKLPVISGSSILPPGSLPETNPDAG